MLQNIQELWSRRLIKIHQFWRALKTIWNTEEICGAERLIAWIAYATRISSLPFWLLIPFEVETTDADTGRHKLIEVYLVIELLMLLVALRFAGQYPILACTLAIYFLCQIFFALFDIVFVHKLEIMRAVVSVERSLLLFMINAAEIVVAFAIFYRVALRYELGVALVTSILVFGTVGHPLDSNLSLASQNWARFVVGAELACDFLFIAIFLGAFIGGLRPGSNVHNNGKPRSQADGSNRA